MKILNSGSVGLPIDFKLNDDSQLSADRISGIRKEKNNFEVNARKYGEAYAAKELKGVLKGEGRGHAMRLWDCIVQCVSGGHGQERSKAEFIEHLRVAYAMSRQSEYWDPDVHALYMKSLAHVLYHVSADALSSVEAVKQKKGFSLEFKISEDSIGFVFPGEVLESLDAYLDTQEVSLSMKGELEKRIKVLSEKLCVAEPYDTAAAEVRPKVAQRIGLLEERAPMSAGKRVMFKEPSESVNTPEVRHEHPKHGVLKSSSQSAAIPKSSVFCFEDVKEFMTLVKNANAIYGLAYNKYVAGSSFDEASRESAVLTEVEAFLGRLAEAVAANPKAEVYEVRISEMVESSTETVKVARGQFNGVLHLFKNYIKHPDKDLSALLSVVIRALPASELERAGYKRI